MDKFAGPELEYACYLFVLTIGVLVLFGVALLTVGFMITHWQVALIVIVLTAIVALFGHK